MCGLFKAFWWKAGDATISAFSEARIWQDFLSLSPCAISWAEGNVDFNCNHFPFEVDLVGCGYERGLTSGYEAVMQACRSLHRFSTGACTNDLAASRLCVWHAQDACLIGIAAAHCALILRLQLSIEVIVSKSCMSKLADSYEHDYHDPVVCVIKNGQSDSDCTDST